MGPPCSPQRFGAADVCGVDMVPSPLPGIDAPGLGVRNHTYIRYRTHGGNVTCAIVTIKFSACVRYLSPPRRTGTITPLPRGDAADAVHTEDARGVRVHDGGRRADHGLVRGGESTTWSATRRACQVVCSRDGEGLGPSRRRSKGPRTMSWLRKSGRFPARRTSARVGDSARA